MSASPPLGSGLYFIDVLACLLFCIVLALVGARFGHEQTVPIDLPRADPGDGPGAETPGPSIAVRSAADGASEILWDGERVTLEEVEARLQSRSPAAVTVRSEASPLARVIALAHGAGVRDIRLAYEARRGEEAAR